MTTLAEVRERDRKAGDDVSGGFADRRFLLAELDRLQAECEALKKAIREALFDDDCDWYSSALEFNKCDGFVRLKKIESLLGELPE